MWALAAEPHWRNPAWRGRPDAIGMQCSWCVNVPSAYSLWLRVLSEELLAYKVKPFYSAEKADKGNVFRQRDAGDMHGDSKC